jgi:hypothetical protein
LALNDRFQLLQTGLIGKNALQVACWNVTFAEAQAFVFDA